MFFICGNVQGSNVFTISPSFGFVLVFKLDALLVLLLPVIDSHVVRQNVHGHNEKHRFWFHVFIYKNGARWTKRI